MPDSAPRPPPGHATPSHSTTAARSVASAPILNACLAGCTLPVVATSVGGIPAPFRPAAGSCSFARRPRTARRSGRARARPRPQARDGRISSASRGGVVFHRAHGRRIRAHLFRRRLRPIAVLPGVLGSGSAEAHVGPTDFLDTDVVTRVALVEGYNTNTYQAQDDPNVPLIRRHPSAFTGVDAGLELRLLGRDTDRTTFNFGARANHYEPLTTQYQSDDGALNASLASRVTIGPRTTLAVSDGAALTSFNAAHVTDGTIFAFDPMQVRSTYWLDDFGAALTHQLSPNSRLTQSLGLTVSGTLQSAPTQARGRRPAHRAPRPRLRDALRRDRRQPRPHAARRRRSDGPLPDP